MVDSGGDVANAIRDVNLYALVMLFEAFLCTFVCESAGHVDNLQHEVLVLNLAHFVVG